MKTNYLKTCLMLIVMIAATNAAKAQNQANISGYDSHENYDIIDNKTPGKTIERIKTDWKGTTYKFELVNKQMTELYVDGEKIPADKWTGYSTVIGEISEQIRIDRIQAKNDQVQAGQDQQQAVKDREQAKIDREQAVKEQSDAKRDQEQAQKDQVQARADQEQAVKDQAQAKIDREQAVKDQEQAVKDQEQAKIDQVEAEEDRRLMKEMLGDLVKDGIVTDENSVINVTLNSTGMTVNDKKMPDDVFARYKSRYSRFAAGGFSYGNDPGSYHNGVHMNRPNH